MSTSNPDTRIYRTTPWNKGRLVGQKRPLAPKHVWSIRIRLEMADDRRGLALFNLAIDSKLRACDLVALKVNDVFVGGQPRQRATVVQRKTGRPVQFEITDTTRAALERWLQHPALSSAKFLFPSRVHRARHISTRQYTHIVNMWIASVGLDPSGYETHSIRRTKAAKIYRKTGNLRAVQLLLGHTKLESTVRCLGIEVDDALKIAESIEL